METLTIKPSMGWKIGYVALLLFLSVLLIGEFPGPSPLTEWGIRQWAAAVLAVSCLVAAIDYPFKAVVVERDFLGKHSWFRWRRRALPSRVRVFQVVGRVVLADAGSGRVLVALARDFGPAARVEGALKAHLRKYGHLSET